MTLAKAVLSHSEITSEVLKGAMAEEYVAAGDSASDGMTLQQWQQKP